MSSDVVFSGGPVDGAVFGAHSRFGRSVIVQGEDHGRPGEVARYRRTNETTPGGKKVYAFAGWDRVVLTVPSAPPRNQRRTED